VWVSEAGSLSKTWDPSIADGLSLAKNIHDFLTVAHVSGYEYWELAYLASVPPSTCANCGLTDSDFHPAKRFYTQGNWSKFMRSGWVRIEATASPAKGIYVTAFKNPGDGAFTIVAINTNRRSVSVDFPLSGFSAPEVTPYVTSESLDLQAQPVIAITSGRFKAALQPQSVTSFVGTASSNNTPSTSAN
jgi:glucuronoarabinoxylan endo-1,4-beta-xylanase